MPGEVMGRGLFIVFEGIDGAGTTTQCRLLAERLQTARPGREVAITAEPTSRPVGRLIRDVLGGGLTGRVTPQGPEPFDRRALALLFAADRLDHMAWEVEPGLAAGRVLLSDRFVLSSLAYQGVDAPRDWVAEINRYAPRPDLTFYLDVPPAVALDRIRSSRQDRDIFETPEFLEQVSSAYREALDIYGSEGVYVLDGTLSQEEVSQRVWARVDPLV